MARNRTPDTEQTSQPKRRMNPVQMVALLLAFVMVAGVGGVLAAGLFIPLAVGASATTEDAVSLFDEVPDELTPGALSQASFVYAADGHLLASFWAQNRIVVPLDEVSDYMKHAVISIEDERFYEHGGIDPRGMIRAVVNNATGASTQGASTLTQQYVKNVLIDQAEQNGDPFGVLEAREDSIARKLREAKLSVALEKTMTKDEVLQGYLNVAQFGVSVYGVESAARYYFSTSAKDLTPVQAATIAGITKAPGQFDPTVNPDQSEVRRNIVLNKMWSLGYITTDEYNEAKATPIADTLNVTEIKIGCTAAGRSAFFCDYVIKEIMTNSEFGETTADRRELLYRGGLKITTTLDRKKQKAAVNTMKEHVPYPNSAGLESVIVSVEPGTGKILAMVQNVKYDPSSSPKKHTTSVNYAADFVHGGSRGFQPGSTFKPYVLAEWLRQGKTLATPVNATKVPRTTGMFRSSCSSFTIGSEGWNPANVDGNGAGYMSVLKATANSVNTAYVDMATKLDLCKVRNTAWDVGYRPTQTHKGVALTKPTIDDIFITPSMVIGTQETSPLGLASSFATFAAQGTHCNPVAITEVITADGTSLDVPSAKCKEHSIPKNVANTVTYALQEVMKSGSGKTATLAGGRPAAGKTGTSQLSAQTWFGGYTPSIATVVWVGEASGNPSHLNILFEGRRIAPMYGSSIAAPAWKAYTDKVLDGTKVEKFPAADPALVGRVSSSPAAPAQSGTGRTYSTTKSNSNNSKSSSSKSTSESKKSDSGAKKSDSKAKKSDSGTKKKSDSGAKKSTSGTKSSGKSNG
ncbi:MAG: penicillin-binding protein [Cellulomonadaceae bacterium]|jgi:membrane peptidoglycan carboxypeptidase|nr:penicillin-binding protein [Cellulomonadaceae bacterium]